MTESVDLRYQILDRAPHPSAIVGGVKHEVLYANRAFLALPGVQATRAIGSPISQVLGWAAPPILGALDRAHRFNAAVCDQLLGTADDHTKSWSCSIWPVPGDEEPPIMVIDVFPSAERDATLVLQRQVAEQLLLSALRESEMAEEARSAEQRASFLAEIDARLGESLDQSSMEGAIRRLALPSAAEWCIVDIVGDDGTPHRLAVVHRDEDVQPLLDTIQDRWSPQPGDLFGVPAVLGGVTPVQVTDNIADALNSRAHDPDVLSVLRELGIGSLLTTPLLADGKVFGAITFVGSKPGRVFTAAEVSLAQSLAARSAFALLRAKLYANTLLLKNKAEGEAETTTKFLRSIGHELRTPLQAIAGYVEIIARGIHGPVTTHQQVDLDRIMASQRHTLILINELLEYMRTGNAGNVVMPSDVSVHEAIDLAFEVIEPQVIEKGLHFTFLCDDSCTVRADESKLHQILINLLSNAVKFTDAGGDISVSCKSVSANIEFAVSDTGRGVEPAMLSEIFEPFVQAERADGTKGLGLGLAISRDLARRMKGDISVISALGSGSTFTLILPAA